MPYNCYIVLKYIVFCIKNVASLFKYVKILQFSKFSKPMDVNAEAAKNKFE